MLSDTKELPKLLLIALTHPESCIVRVLTQMLQLLRSASGAWLQAIVHAVSRALGRTAQPARTFRILGRASILPTSSPIDLPSEGSPASSLGILTFSLVLRLYTSSPLGLPDVPAVL